MPAHGVKRTTQLIPHAVLQRLQQTITPAHAQRRYPLDIVEEVGRIGISPYHASPVIGITSPSGPMNTTPSFLQRSAKAGSSA